MAGVKRKPVSRQVRHERALARKVADGSKHIPPQKPSSSIIKGKKKLDKEEGPHPFRYRSFNDRLDSIRINVATDLGRSGTGALAGLDAHGLAARADLAIATSTSALPIQASMDDFDDDSMHEKTSFILAVQAWRELNLSLPFTSLAQKLAPLSSSLPLLLHNQEQITDILAQALGADAVDAYLSYEPVLDLIPRLATDLGPAFLSSYETLIGVVLRSTSVTRANCEGEDYTAAVIVERAFESLAATLRCMAPFILRETDSREAQSQDWLEVTWMAIRPYLGWKPLFDRVEVSVSLDSRSSGRRKRHKQVPQHTRRFAAEAFAHLLRRAKSEQMQRLAAIMLLDARRALECVSSAILAKVAVYAFLAGVGAVWSEVVKSVEGKLHSRATTYLAILLNKSNDGLSDENVAVSEARTVVGAYLTASIANHAKAVDLVPVARWMLDSLDCSLQSDPGTYETSQEHIIWLTILVGLHKGKHVDESLKGHLFTTLRRLSASVHHLCTSKGAPSAMASSIVELLQFALPLARMQDLVGPALHIVNEQADLVKSGSLPMRTIFAPLSQDLAKANFHGFEQLMWPAVQDVTGRYFASGADGGDTNAEAMALVNALHQIRNVDLQRAPLHWQEALMRAVSVQLRQFKERAESLTAVDLDPSPSELVSIALADVPNNVAGKQQSAELLCDLIGALTRRARSHAFDTAQQEFRASPTNLPALIGAAIVSLTNILKASSDRSLFDKCVHALSSRGKGESLQAIATRFAWHRSFVIALGDWAAAAEANSSESHLLLTDNLLQAFSDALCSADAHLRKAACKVLKLAERSLEGGMPIFAKLLAIELCGLEVDRIRERNVLLRSLARDLARDEILKEHSSKSKCPVYVQVALRNIVSTMKLNLRPLWPESRAALQDLIAQFGQQVWEISFQELKSAGDAKDPWESMPIAWSKLQEQSRGAIAEQSCDYLVEGNDTVVQIFRDPFWITRMTSIQLDRRETFASRALSDIIEGQIGRDRLDGTNYQQQILTLFAEIAALAERNNSPLIDHFFSVIVNRPDESAWIMDPVDDESEGSDTDEEQEEDREVVSSKSSDRDADQHVQEALNHKERQSQLCAYLQVFARFSNPKAVHRSEELYTYLNRLCSQGEVRIQRLALDAILRWKNPAHVAHSQLLKALLEPNEFREQLTNLSLAPASEGTLHAEHRTALLPLLLRIFFGLIISRKSRAGGQANRRAAILTALALVTDEEMTEWTGIMLESFEDICTMRQSGQGYFIPSYQAPTASERIQQGFLSLLDDMLKYLGPRLITVWTPLLCTTLNIAIHASTRASASDSKASKTYRRMRQDGLRLLDAFFQRLKLGSAVWLPFMPTVFDKLLSPRLPSLRDECIQSPSTILQLAHTWSSDKGTILFIVRYDDNMLPSLLSVLEAPNVKPVVIDMIIDIMANIVALSVGEPDDPRDDDEVGNAIFRPHLAALLRASEHLLRQISETSNAIFRRSGQERTAHRLLELLLAISVHVEQPDEVHDLVRLLGTLLVRSRLTFNEKGRIAILSVLDRLLPIWLLTEPDDDAVDVLYQPLSASFSRASSRQARSLLCNIFTALAQHDTAIEAVSIWLCDLNAFDSKRLEEYDFDRRLSAFEAVKGNDSTQNTSALTTKQWLPLLHNFIFYLNDDQELAIRASAAAALRHFIDVISEATNGVAGHALELQQLLTKVVFAGLRRGIRAPSDLVKREAVEILGHAVAQLPMMPFAVEMRGLLVEGDDEASFFTNIFHIQSHRRARAMNRLGTEAQSGNLKSRSIMEIFLPIVENFLKIEVNHGDSNKVQNAVECVGQLASKLVWGPYNALLWRFLSLAKAKDKDEVAPITDKVSVRTAMAILDNFHFDLDAEAVVVPQNPSADFIDEHEGDEELVEKVVAANESKRMLDVVLERLLPKLMGCLEVKDELEDVVRLPIAVGIARILLRLPNRARNEEIKRLLNVLAHILRSKSQDTRDLVRSTLCKVAVILGPSYFATMVAELRKILNRGPQIAVLAFTIHNVLLYCTSNAADSAQKLETLDEGVNLVVDIAIEDIFGRTAEDRQSVENRTTYREVRSTRSLDTIQNVARLVCVSRIRALLSPLKELMSRTESAQAVRLFDDYLRHVSIGLQANNHLDSHEYLILCGALLDRGGSFTSSVKFEKGDTSSRGTSALLAKRQAAEAGPVRDHFVHNKHRFLTFGLELLTSALRKERFDFGDSTLLSKLEAFVALVGSTLLGDQTGVVIGSMRCLSLLLRCPIRSVRSAQPSLLRQTLKIIERQGNARSETLLAGIKLLTVIIREGKKDGMETNEEKEGSVLSENQVAHLCRIIDANLDEDVETQSALFALLRGIIFCKVATAELYDLMDKVARMIVVHQSESIRGMCRASYLAFLLDMPQGRKRFDNQVHFFVKNLDYIYESGRQSVLDTVALIVEKVSRDVLKTHMELLFVGLVMRLANEESAKCRERAVEIVKQIILACDKSDMTKVIKLAHTWGASSHKEENSRMLLRVAMMLYNIMIELDSTRIASNDWIEGAESQAMLILTYAANDLELYETDSVELENEEEQTAEWQPVYYSLQFLAHDFRRRREIWASSSEEQLLQRFLPLWSFTSRILLYPHAWVRLASCRLLGEKFATMSPQEVSTASALEGSIEMGKRFALVLQSPNVDEALSTQAVKNLLFLGKGFLYADNAFVQQSQGEEPIYGRINGEDGKEDDEEAQFWRSEPLRWLFNKLSHQLRRSCTERLYIAQGAAVASQAILKWMAGMFAAFDAETASRYLVHVISPLYRLLEASKPESGVADAPRANSAGAERRTALESLGREVQDLVQAKVGTQRFAKCYADVRRKATAKRHDRRERDVQRRVDHPESAVTRKAHRNVRKHQDRKRKSEAFASSKERVRAPKRQR